ncbi:hypothetical protein NPIL_184761 [Nephila pilipes]|uniref:Uncharacterized protein n=1 Tax=Nephila pilipes TaxID=299642 RepID=A0A8X6TVW1_NEPPI|nr:hypothetical protein NPIL_184761 [Nephila pilipes]
MKQTPKIDLLAERAKSDVIAVREPKEGVMKGKKRLLEISYEKQLISVVWRTRQIQNGRVMWCPINVPGQLAPPADKSVTQLPDERR